MKSDTCITSILRPEWRRNRVSHPKVSDGRFTISVVFDRFLMYQRCISSGSTGLYRPVRCVSDCADITPAKSNAVKLGRVDGWGGWSVGLGPVGVAGSFDVPFGVFAFDDSRAGSVSAFRVEAPQELDDCSFPSVVAVSARRGENRALVKASGE